MLVQSTRFGSIQAAQEEIIIFPSGLIGFESTKHWMILPDPENLDVAWLQSVAQPQVALPLVSPRKFAPNYKVTVTSRQLSVLHTRSTDRIFIMLIVSKTGKTLTANLRGPVIINLTQRIASQIIADEALPLALPLTLTGKPALRMAA